MNSIAVVGGTGALGGALARRLALAGHTVWLGSRDPEKARSAAASLSAATGKAVMGGGLGEAAANSALCFLAVPYAAQEETLAQIQAQVQGKIVVDTTAPLRPPKVGTVQLPTAGCAAVETARRLGDGVRVVSALQTIGADKLASGEPIDADVLVTSDDAEAAEVVCGLLGDIGLRAWHAGPLANSAAAEAMTSVLIQLNRRYKLAQAGIRITGKRKDAPPVPAVTVKALAGLPLFGPGDDIAGAIFTALADSGDVLHPGDVVVVAQKIVSKSEARAVDLATVVPRQAARDAAERAGKDPAVVELVVSEASELMRVAPGVIIARHRTGHVLANAGIDASNVADDSGRGVALLWPVDPDASARRLRDELQRRFGVTLAVIVSDSVGRAWRMGTTGTAIGVAGIRPLRDRRGEADLFGRELQATVVGVADEIAAAASLVIGEGAEGTPVAIVRGAIYETDDVAVAADLLRPLDRDLFR